jgi:hypothetical protein
MAKFIQRHLLVLIGTLIGAIAGYLYWKWVGCNSGSCAITSRPVNSSLYGAVIGALLFSLFSKTKNETV